MRDPPVPASLALKLQAALHAHLTFTWAWGSKAGLHVPMTKTLLTEPDGGSSLENTVSVLLAFIPNQKINDNNYYEQYINS